MSRNIRQQRADLEGVREPKKRNRSRVEGSWRDLDKGKCYTRTNSNGGSYTVCEGSKGQAGQQDRNKRGDPDQKGRSKKEAINYHKPMLKKYDEKGKLIYSRQKGTNLGKFKRFIPLRQEGDKVFIVEEQPEHIVARKEHQRIKPTHKNEKSIPIAEFNAQYRVIRKGGKNFKGYSLK